MLSIRQKELEYFKKNQIPAYTAKRSFRPTEVRQRESEIFFEAFNQRPQDIFYFTLNNTRFIGRKFLSELSIAGKITGTKDSQLTAAMILGIANSEQITDEGIIIAFHPLENGEKLFLFDSLASDLLTEIHFPYPFLNVKHEEDISPDDFWDPTTDQVDSLNAGEVHIREYTQKFLARFNLKDKIVYDPACSTGEFLGSIKSNHPEIRAIGQDLNKKMANYAKKTGKLDIVLDGDAKQSPIKEESVDFIFFRFLNLEVVSTKTAHEIFPKIANRCKNGGYLILLGHTPLLMNAQWFQKLGLTVEQCIAHNGISMFQYYVLKKTQPVPELRYEQLQILDRAKSPQPKAAIPSQALFQPETNNDIKSFTAKSHLQARL